MASPSKLHMGHYIASCEHDETVQIYLIMMALPFYYGVILDSENNSSIAC